MTKKVALIVLAVFCVFAIYNLRTPTTESQNTEVPLENGTLVEETIVPAENIEAAVEADRAPSATSAQKKVSTLKEILASKNDNDPRMDTELKNLSNEDKDALVDMYNDLKPERLNDKGTIAFLIGREMTRPEDAEFLKNILSEEPCLSLENCGVTNAGNDPHMDSVNNVTLSYPQIVALNRIKNFVETKDIESVNPNILAHLADAAKIGQNSKIPMVQVRAKEIANLLTPDLTPDLTKHRK